jgi:hypothetical protein
MEQSLWRITEEAIFEHPNENIYIITPFLCVCVWVYQTATKIDLYIEI